MTQIICPCENTLAVEYEVRWYCFHHFILLFWWLGSKALVFLTSLYEAVFCSTLNQICILLRPSDISVFVIGQSDIFTHTNDCLSLAVQDSGAFPAAAAGAAGAVVVLLVAAAGVIYYRRRSSRKGKFYLQILKWEENIIVVVKNVCNSVWLFFKGDVEENNQEPLKKTYSEVRYCTVFCLCINNEIASHSDLCQFHLHWQNHPDGK